MSDDWKPGRKPYVSGRQRQILEYVETHPWSKLYTISKELKLHSFNTLSSLSALESKGMLDVCMICRIKHWSKTGTPLAPGAMLLDRGAPSLYHTNIKGQIIKVLEKEPWLPMCSIEARLSKYGTAKSIESRLLSMVAEGALQRKVVDTPRRRMYVYALPGNFRLSEKRIERIYDEVASSSKFWKTEAVVLKILKRNPWRTARQIAEAGGIKLGFVYNSLKILLERSLIKRVKINGQYVGHKKPADFVWSLQSETKLPGHVSMVPDVPKRAEDRTSSKVLTVVQELGNATCAQIVARFNEKYGSPKLSFNYASVLLKDLVEFGRIHYSRIGRHAGGYSPNPSADQAVIGQAADLKKDLDSIAHALRELGYEVSVEISCLARASSPGLRIAPISENIACNGVVAK
jgi:predicted transcriptional regulator